MKIPSQLRGYLAPAAILAAVATWICLPAIGQEKAEETPPDTGGGPPGAPGNPANVVPAGDLLASHTVVPGKELMISEWAVVESDRAKTETWDPKDPKNAEKHPWHIASLLTNLNGGNEPSRMMMEWLAQWEKDSVVNGFPLKARKKITELVIQPWLDASHAKRPTNGDWSNFKLDWAKAPFRLLAIVNRIDLANDPELGTVDSAGEGRFVFGVLDRNGKPMDFTVILEYKQQASTKDEFDAWARNWHALGARALGTDKEFKENYLQALEKVTSAFAAGPKLSLKQLRTNSTFDSDEEDWELREFHLVKGALVPAPVKQTPDPSFQLLGPNDPKDEADPTGKKNARKSATLTDFLAKGPAELPEQFPAKSEFNPSDYPVPFLAASALNPLILDPDAPQDDPGHHLVWTARNIQSERLHTFALNTCSGCHGAEGGMKPLEFTMVQPREKNKASKLAGFLTGVDPDDSDKTSFKDPREPWRKMSFKNDLKARALILQRLTEPKLIKSFPTAPGESVPEEPLLGRGGRVH